MKSSSMLKILPPIWFFIFLLLALALHFFVTAAHVFNLSGFILYKIIGIVIFIVGMGLSLQASKQFKEENTEIIPTSPTNRVLIIKGAFKYSRNPMYLGMVLSLIGIGLFVGTLPVLVAALAQFVVLNFFFIPFEEEKMARQFGDTYTAYKSSVRRWI